MAFEIPTFTVTINPLESNEMTFVPSSPPETTGFPDDPKHHNNTTTTSSTPATKGIPTTPGTGTTPDQPLLEAGLDPKRCIANTTVIVDDEVNAKLMLSAGQVQ